MMIQMLTKVDEVIGIDVEALQGVSTLALDPHQQAGSENTIDDIADTFVRL